MTKWEYYQNEIDSTAQVGAKVLAACNNEKGKKIMYDNFVDTINTYRSLQSSLSYEDAMKEWRE